MSEPQFTIRLFLALERLDFRGMISMPPCFFQPTAIASRYVSIIMPRGASSVAFHALDKVIKTGYKGYKNFWNWRTNVRCKYAGKEPEEASRSYTRDSSSTHNGEFVPLMRREDRIPQETRRSLLSQVWRSMVCGKNAQSCSLF